MKKAVVVGSGAGGAMAAHELQGQFAVTVLEAGKEFKPFQVNVSFLEKLKKTGLFLDEREIRLLFPFMKVERSSDKIVMVRGLGTGGTTTISAGNALRMDHGLKAIGIDLDDEFAELYCQIPITYDHRNKWSKSSLKLFDICQKLGLNPQVIPKFGDYSKCTKCGRCVLGCKYGAKWDSRQLLSTALSKGAQLETNCRVKRLVIQDDVVIGVEAKQGLKTIFYPADLVILAAGGLGTPLILQNSGIACEDQLFVDPVLCVAAKYEGSLQNRELSMPFAVQSEHYILSPYFDYLSFFFNRKWRHPAADTLSLMIKLADTNTGSIDNYGIKKALTPLDKARLQNGVELCQEILMKLGIRKDDMFLGTINAGHPGGMLPLTEAQASTLHNPRLPNNLYVADATVFPQSLGNPPILTIMALAKKICQQASAANR